MMVNTEALVAMTEANQNFSKVTHIVDENGFAVILKNNKPRYIVVDFEEYEAIKGIRAAREKKLELTADTLIEENMEAFLELAK
ncbi:type II toxin-antitoxin system Phd/YefM family antitoxin [Clostridium sp. MCC353]|uniref:type II toxin-antitoxin system Phd/YefM family antitoxin n=1 Tax=Clostridium sp. MCC353 TaxID=2592646 RepID=UPI001C012975|nr:type II toxin-antitoxin system Phd/YefM family antitoxin [Clostridium sp. MCC353]MBT9778974.1 type II toxin-antitoxin system Phd/YefM family antitoxin [Clostridium sp. MCC353]